MPSSSDAGAGRPVGAARLLRESPPLAAVTLSWVVVSWFANHPLVGTGARYAGVVMAGSYAVVRGVALAREAGAPGNPTDLPSGRLAGGAWLLGTRLLPPDLLRGDLLRGNVAAVLAGGAWLLAARLVLLVESVWNGLGLPGLFRSPAPGLVFALTATGVLTVLLAAVAVGLPLVRTGGQARTDGVPEGR
ncbi:MAG: hypothetical protein V5A60_06655 [Haloarculaceae archaeon]